LQHGRKPVPDSRDRVGVPAGVRASAASGSRLPAETIFPGSVVQGAGMATGGRVEAVRVRPLATRRPAVPVEVLAARTLSLATLGPRRRAERRGAGPAEPRAAR